MKKTNRFETHPFIYLFLSGIFCVTLLDFTVAKVYTRIVGYPWAERESRKSQILRKEAARIEKSYRISSSIYHHDLAKNISMDNARWGGRIYHVSTDSLGFKNDSNRPIDSLSARYRILFIGDSFTEGVGVEYHNTFVGILAQKFSAQKDIAVLNAAVSSYSPIIYWRKVKYLIEDIGLRVDEVIVFLDLSDAYDEVMRYTLREDGTIGGKTVDERDAIEKPRPLVDKVKLALAGRSILGYALFDALFLSPDKRLNRIRSVWTFNEEMSQRYGREGLGLMNVYMNRLHALLQKHEILLTIAVYPWPDQIMQTDRNPYYVTFWQTWAEKRHVRFLNYFPVFIPAEVSSQNNQRILDTYFIPGDVHWNEQGHQLVARTFWEFYWQ